MAEISYMAVTDEIWESSRWFISTGWSKPIAEPQFADFLKAVEWKDFPTAPAAPVGWKWVSEWIIDNSQSFGPVDADGWAYGTSFEALQEAIETNSTSSESGGMKALVRRRKWVRTRACHSKDIHDQLTSKVETLNSTRACIEGSMRQQQKNLTRVKKYELARVRAYETAFGEFNEDMDRVGKVMRDYMIKLARMKTFLLERSAIEREYSQKLKQLSTKWIDAGDTTPTSTRNRNTSVDSSRESFMLASDRSPTDIGSTTDISAQKPRTGFFYLINSTSLEVGENLEGFSELLSDSLCKDVDDTLYEVSRVATEYLNEAPKLRAGLMAKEESVVKTIRVLHSDVDIFLAKASNNIMSVMNEIVALQTTGKPSTASVVAMDKQTVLFDCVGYSDIFLCFQKYRKAVKEVTLHLEQVDRFYKVKFPLAQNCSMRVGVLLQSIAKIFANEQKRIWAGANELGKHLTAMRNISNNNSEAAEMHSDNSAVIADADEPGNDSNEITHQADDNDEDNCADYYATLIKTIAPPECAGIVKYGMIRYCETPEALMASAGVSGLVSLSGKDVMFTDVYAILFVDGMLHLYENTPASNSILARKAYAEVTVDKYSDRDSKQIEQRASIVSDSWADWIGECPVRSLCLANSSGAVSVVVDPIVSSSNCPSYVSQFSANCEVSVMLSCDSDQDIFKVTCYTTRKAASISMASANTLSRSAAELSGSYASASSVFTSCLGATEGDAREWIHAIMQPYNRNKVKDVDEIHL